MKTFFTTVAVLFIVVVATILVMGSMKNTSQQEEVGTVKSDTTKEVVQPTGTTTSTSEGDKKITEADVAKHASPTDCWIIVAGKVYSVASFISIHPGGKDAIINQCGGDATTAFQTRGGTGVHSSRAQSTLGTFFIGNLAQGN